MVPLIIPINIYLVYILIPNRLDGLHVWEAEPKHVFLSHRTACVRTPSRGWRRGKPGDILAGPSGFTRARQGSRNRSDRKGDFVEGGTAGAIPRVFMKLGEGR